MKIITTGEGGAVLTNNKIYAEKIRMFRENGITNSKLYFKNKPYYSGYYEQIYTGYNYRMSDISAALGINQLRHLKKFVLEKQNCKLLQKIFIKYFNQMPKNFKGELF